MLASGMLCGCAHGGNLRATVLMGNLTIWGMRIWHRGNIVTRDCSIIAVQPLESGWVYSHCEFKAGGKPTGDYQVLYFSSAGATIQEHYARARVTIRWKGRDYSVIAWPWPMKSL